MSIKIRVALEHDFQQIYDLNLQFSHFIKTPEKFKITIEDMIADQDLFKIFVAENHDGRIVGFATTFVVWYSWIGKSMYLDDLFVVEQFRGKGLGSMLIDEVIRQAKTIGCKKVKWQVSKWNQSAIEFYKAKGAEIDDVEINCDLVFE